MSTKKCEECQAALDPTKILRCTKCKACCYCSRECQTRNWRLHKRVCSTEPSLQPFIPVEMAIERVLKKCPKMEEAPKDATCYICLEGEDGGKLMRGCACRGDSAGFVHLECLTKLALSKEGSSDSDARLNVWTFCGNCKQRFTGALNLEMHRRCWQRYRSVQNQRLRYTSTRKLAACLGVDGEIDAVNQLLDEASTCVGNNTEALLSLNLHRAAVLLENGQKLEALERLQAILPEAKVYTTNPTLVGHTMKKIADTLLGLHRYQEAYEMATELVAFAKGKFGLEDPKTLSAMTMYAQACANLGRREESKATLEDVLTTQTRVLGREHPNTQFTRRVMSGLGFAAPSG